MANGARVNVTQGADQVGVQLIARFRNGGDAKATASRYCATVTLVSGEAPSYAFIGVPMRAFPADEGPDPRIALKANGPAGLIPLKSRCEIGYSEGGKTQTVMAGSLVKYSHNFDEDSLVGEIYDDKWLATKICTWGRSVYDPSTEEGGAGSGNYYFDATSPLIFNFLGHPDCLDTKYGPVFAPSFRFGWRQSSYEDLGEPAPGYATRRARSWRVEDILLYLRGQYGYEAVRPTPQVDYGTMNLQEDSISWTKAACHFVGSDRTVRDFSLQNETLLSALQATIRKAGAYDVYMSPIGGYRSELRFVNFNPKTRTGSRLFLPGYDSSAIAALMNAGDVVHSGNMSESVINTFDEGVCIVGDPVAVERWVGTDPTDSTTVINSTVSLQPAWDPAAEAAFKQYLIAHDGRPSAFAIACKVWPDVFVAYQVGRGSPLFAGTKWGDTKLGCRYPRIKPALLTGYNNDGNPKGWQPKSITVEYKLSKREWCGLDDDNKAIGFWRAANTFDALALNPDSTILYLPGLREAQQTWYFNACPIVGACPDDDHPDDCVPSDDCPDGVYDGRCMTRREIRMNIAVESDWALTGRSSKDPNNTASRTDPTAEKYTFTTVAQKMDYLEDLRLNSHPHGLAEVSSEWRGTNYPDKASEGNELFTDRPTKTSGRMYTHAQWREGDVNRIDYSGAVIIARMNPAMYPGLPLSVEGEGTIPNFSVVKCVVLDAGAQTTTVQFGAPDSAMIYDGPQRYTVPAIPVAPFSATPDTNGGHGSYKEGGGKPGTTDETGGKSQTQGTTTTGGASQTQADDYVYQEGFKPGQTSATTNEKTEKGPVNVTSDEKKSSTPGEKAWSREESYSYGDEGKKGQQQKHEDKKQARQDAKDRKDAARERKEPGAGFGGFLGKPNSGSINGKDSSKIQFGNSLLGKNNSGTINGKSDLRGIANGMADTRKADKYDRDNYKSTPRDNDVGVFDAIAKSQQRQDDFKRQGQPQAPAKAPAQAPKAPPAPEQNFKIEPSKPKAPAPKVAQPDDE